MGGGGDWDYLRARGGTDYSRHIRWGLPWRVIFFFFCVALVWDECSGFGFWFGSFLFGAPQLYLYAGAFLFVFRASGGYGLSQELADHVFFVASGARTTTEHGYQP